MQRKTLKVKGNFRLVRPVYDATINFSNASKWKSNFIPYYGKTNNDIIKDAVKKGFDIVNYDETNLPLLRFNENKKCMVNPGAKPAKAGKHATRITVLVRTQNHSC